MKVKEAIAPYTTATLRIVDAAYQGDLTIALTFNDEHEVEVDFTPFLQSAQHPSIKKYAQEALFKQFRLRDGNLDWNDFDLCFPIEDLYNNLI